MALEHPVRIAVWSDYVCPFCYLEEPVLSRVHEAHGGTVEIGWRAFELRPEPARVLDPDAPYLHRVWNQAVYPMAQARGMTLRLPPVQPRSRKALEAAEFARGTGRFEAMHHALFRAFFEDGRDIGDIGVLTDIGRAAGCDGDALHSALADGRFTAKVLADEAEADRLGLTGVPALVVGRTDKPIEDGVLVSGAQPDDVVQAAIDRVRKGKSTG